MENYEPGREIRRIQQPYLPGMEKREPIGNRRLVLERTIADFWKVDAFNVASQIREFFVADYNDEEHYLLQGAWDWVQRGGLLKEEEKVDLELPLEVLLNRSTVFFWTGMKEALKDPGLGNFPVACEVDTDVWRDDIRAICGECMHKMRTVAVGELHKGLPKTLRTDIITKIEEFRGPFRGLTNEGIMRMEKVDLITYALLLDYYMTLVKRGRWLLEIY